MSERPDQAEPEVFAESSGAVLTIWLNRPRTRNALTDGVIAQLMVRLEEARRDEQTRVVALRGVDRTFCSGGDMRTRPQGLMPAQNALRVMDNRRLAESLRTMNKIVVAAVEGWAIGAGLGLALAADLMVAGESARFRPGFIKHGLTPDFATGYLLARQLGVARARAMLIEDRVVTAREAVDLGMAAHVWPDDEFDERLAALLTGLADLPPNAAALTRVLADQAAHSDLSTAWTLEGLATTVLGVKS